MNRNNSTINTDYSKGTTNSSKPHLSRIPLWTIPIWLVVWQVAAMCIGSDILLVSPIKVVVCLGEQIVTGAFWKAIGFSFVRIVSGFLSAVILGTCFAALSYRFRIVRQLLALPVAVVKATPVASFIILVLVWVPSKNLSIFISFLMSFPVVYANVLQGLDHSSKELLEMSKVFRLSLSKRIRYIYTPEVLPFFSTACKLSLGFCWKSGIAAEVIGLPRGSIGERLYQAKIYLETPELFAWTVVIVVVSILFEKIVMFLVNSVVRKLGERL